MALTGSGGDSSTSNIMEMPQVLRNTKEVHHDLPELVQPTEKETKPTAETLETYNAFRDYIETFLIEVYRCKLCKFNSAVKHTIGDHMKNTHFDSIGSVIKVNAVDGSSGNLDILQRKDVNMDGVQTVRSSGNMPIVNLSDLTTQQNDAVSLSNALEVLMGLGNECSAETMAIVNQEAKKTPSKKIKRKKNRRKSNGDIVSIPFSSANGVPDSEQLQDPPLTDAVAAAAAAASLNADDDDDDDDDVDYDPSMEVESDRSTEELSEDVPYRIRQVDPSRVSQEPMPSQPAHNHNSQGDNIPKVSNKTAPVLQSVDVSAIAKTAALSNPDATTITVVQHNAGEGPPTTIQFKKSRKSDAIIPTRESLGIVSPFTKTKYGGAKIYACTTCHSRYKTEDELERHTEKKHQRNRKFLCEICGEALATRASVRHHVSRKHPDDTSMFKCEHCDYMTRFETRMKIHSSKHNSEFFCELCNKCYVTKEKLQAHYLSPMHKNALNPIICEHCGYKTKKRDNFLVHMRKHTGEKPYRCTQCDYASSDGSTLKKHVMAKHSNIRPFKCDAPLCNFSCVDKKGLTIHMRKHTGERPFKCLQCNYAAKRRSALNVHMQTHRCVDTVVKLESQVSRQHMGGKGKLLQRPPLPDHEVASYETVTITEVASLAPIKEQHVSTAGTTTTTALPPCELTTTQQRQYTTTTTALPPSELTTTQQRQYTTMDTYQPQMVQLGAIIGNGANSTQSPAVTQSYEIQQQVTTADSIQGQIAIPNAGASHTFTVQIPTTPAIEQDATEQAVATIWQEM